jgi:hypothetical protein
MSALSPDNLTEIWVTGTNATATYSGWQDIANKILVRDNSGEVRITRGLDERDVDPNLPSSMVGQINNQSGNFSDQNPTGIYYGLIGRNTKIRQSKRYAYDAFGRTSSNGWGTADSGQAWSTNGGAAADYSVSGGTGNISNASVNVIRETFFDPTGPMSPCSTAPSAPPCGPVSWPPAPASRSALMAPRRRLQLPARGRQLRHLRLRQPAHRRPGRRRHHHPRLDLRHADLRRTDSVPARVLGVRRPVHRPAVEHRRPEHPDLDLRRRLHHRRCRITAAGSVGCRSILSTGNTNGTHHQVRRPGGAGHPVLG